MGQTLLVPLDLRSIRGAVRGLQLSAAVVVALIWDPRLMDLKTYYGCCHGQVHSPN